MFANSPIKEKVDRDLKQPWLYNRQYTCSKDDWVSGRASLLELYLIQ